MAGDSKTEKATPKKRKDERKKGNVFQSKDVANVVSTLAIFYTIKLMMPFIYRYLSNFILKYIGYMNVTKELNITIVKEILIDSVIAVVVIAGPVMLVTILTSIISTGAQTKFIFSMQSLKPKFSRINPLEGFKRLFSMRSAVELIKSLIKVIVIGYVLYKSFMDIADGIIKLITTDILGGIIFITDSIMSMVIKMCIVFLVIAGFDFLFQWWEYEKNLKMSKQDIKDEYKHQEGDPQVKGKIKERQRKMAMQRMMQQVPTADVVIKNPTHFAVALKYDIQKDRAPIVVAKGQDEVALRIIDIAEKNNIPVKENIPLARALYSTVEVNQEIPADYYSILAEIMAWVYSINEGRINQ